MIDPKSLRELAAYDAAKYFGPDEPGDPVVVIILDRVPKEKAEKPTYH